MSKKIDTLKYAIFNEWSYDPPAGGCTLYYAALGKTYREIKWPVGETYDHLSCSVYDEEAEELEAAYNAVNASRKSIANYSWENGGLGCGCDFVAVGKEIAPKAAEFYQRELAERFEDCEEEKEKKAKAIIDKALKNPENYEALMSLLELIDDAIDSNNSMMF